MKTRFSQFFAFVMLAGLLMQGCQKEPQSVDSAGQADEMAYTPKAVKLVADINSFKQKMTAVRENPHLKSGEVISKEEARWNIETLFNVTYGFPDLSYSKTITDTALVYLPVDASGNALLEDVVAVYEEVLALVTDFYLAANFDEKGFLFMKHVLTALNAKINISCLVAIIMAINVMRARIENRRQRGKSRNNQVFLQLFVGFEHK